MANMNWTLRRLVYGSFLLGISTQGRADILEERIATGTNLFVPTAFPLNPATNLTSVTVVGVQMSKRDEELHFITNPGQNEAEITEKIAKKDLSIGGQYPLGGAAVGLAYSEQRRNVSARHINRNEDNHELFVNRDYRLNFGVDFTPELRGAFTFHYTATQSDLEGNFFINDSDRTRYNGTMSGYGLGLYYQPGALGIGAFSHPPMRGKAMVEGEQKIITEPGLYGLSFDFRANPKLSLSFNVTRWSYKHDERDDPTTSPVNQQDILLRGLDLNQFLRKTMSYGIAAEYAATPMVFVKGQYLKQEGVFLFDADHVPGDDKELETKIRYPEYRVGVAIKNRSFIAEFGLLNIKAEEGSIRARSGFGNVGNYKASTTGLHLMAGAAF